MAKPLRISEDVYQKVPGLIIITGILEIGAPQTDLISGYLISSWSKLAEAVREHGYKTHPLIARWREALRNAGVPLKKYAPSIEAIAKRTTKSESPFSFNPIVDTYNAISMDLVLPFGAYDIEQIDGELSLRVCHGPESFSPLGGGELEQTEVMVATFFSFVVSWGDYLVISIVNQSQNTATLRLILQRLSASLLIRWGQVAAATVLTIVPTIILFSFIQRFLVEGLTAGAVKGE